MSAKRLKVTFRRTPHYKGPCQFKPSLLHAPPQTDQDTQALFTDWVNTQANFTDWLARFQTSLEERFSPNYEVQHAS